MQLQADGSFNSMKVRLKRLARYHLALGFAFQFHEGPIKTNHFLLFLRFCLVSIP